jgi:predicted DNA-binding protein
VTAKKQMTFRLSQNTTKELEALAKRYNVSQAEVIAVIVHLVYTGEDIDSLDTWFDIVKL